MSLLRFVRLPQTQGMVICLPEHPVFPSSRRSFEIHYMLSNPGQAALCGVGDCLDGGGSQICTAVRLSWQPIKPVQLHSMPSCPPVNKLGPSPDWLCWRYGCVVGGWLKESTFPRLRTALKINALHCLCHLSKVLPTCCIHLSRISKILGPSTKHHEISAAVRRPQLGVTREPRPRHPPSIRHTLGISHPVRLQHALV